MKKYNLYILMLVILSAFVLASSDFDNLTIRGEEQILESFTSCTALETNATGYLVCGADDVGGAGTYNPDNKTLINIGGEDRVNMSYMNITMDDRDSDTTYSAGTNMSLAGTTFSWDATWAILIFSQTDDVNTWISSNISDMLSKFSANGTRLKSLIDSLNESKEDNITVQGCAYGQVFTNYSDGTFTCTADIDTNSSDGIRMDYLPGSIYEYLQNWTDTTQSAGLISGGNIVGNDDGTINVSAGTGFIKVSDSVLANTIFMNWSATNNIDMSGNNNTKHTIYVDYNAGTPIVAVTTATINYHTQFSIGSAVYEVKKNVSDEIHEHLHILNNAGTRVMNLARRVQRAMREGGFDWVSGATIGSNGLNITITAGVFYAGIDRLTLDAYDSNNTVFHLYFYNGSEWIQDSANIINNTHYNDITSGLSELTANRYGVHWVYEEVEGHVVVLYGQGDYTLSNAQESQPPSSVPEYLNAYGILIGRIIVKKEDSSFTETASYFGTVFPSTASADHGELAGLTDDDHNGIYYTETEIDSYIASNDTTIDNCSVSGVCAATLLYNTNTSFIYDTCDNGTFPTTTYVDAQDSAQDACDEITGCNPNSYTSMDNITTVGNCTGGLCPDVLYNSNGSFIQDQISSGDGNISYSSGVLTLINLDLGQFINSLNWITTAFVNALLSDINNTIASQDACDEITGCNPNSYTDISNFTDTVTAEKWCIYNGAEINCTVDPVEDTTIDNCTVSGVCPTISYEDSTHNVSIITMEISCFTPSCSVNETWNGTCLIRNTPTTRDKQGIC